MEPSIIENVESDVDDGEFYFESDHLALRGNSDYTAVLRAIAILQAQRIQATKDIDRLALAEKQALDDPDTFLKKLSAGEDMSFPGPISVVDLPKIDFEKYNVKFPEFPAGPIDNPSNQDLIVRGRMFDQSKPETFNQLWTCEEQRRLEELLVEYPPEPVEMRRFAKIARALGNRTTKQVASRLQKYFKKLHSVGMPVPGRLPKAQRQFPAKNHRTHKHTLRPSTFFPAHDVPVQMTEDDDLSGGIPFDPFQRIGPASQENSTTSFDRDQPSSSQGVIIVDEHSDDDGKVLKPNLAVVKLLHRIRRDKEKDTVDRPQSEHIGYVCDFCSVEPINGTRWHCTTCSERSVDFCSDCLITQLMSDDPHPIAHKFNGLRISSFLQTTTTRLNSPFEGDSDDDEIDEDNKPNSDGNIYDKDYMPSKFSKDNQYNYLDPNFLPE